MKTENEYRFADLQDDSQILRQIRELENRIKEDYGEEITLIAYTHSI